MATVAQTAAPAGGPNISNILSPGTMQPQGTSTPSQPHQAAHHPSGGSPGSQPSSLEAQQLAYQQAFLQNAVAQNMQIQQQLMMQNQALAQLLQQTPPQTAPGITNTTAAAAATANSSMSTIMGTPSLPSMIPMVCLLIHFTVCLDSWFVFFYYLLFSGSVSTDANATAATDRANFVNGS